MRFRKCCRITLEFWKIKAKALAEDVILQLVNNGRSISIISEIILVEKKKGGCLYKNKLCIVFIYLLSNILYFLVSCHKWPCFVNLASNFRFNNCLNEYVKKLFDKNRVHPNIITLSFSCGKKLPNLLLHWLFALVFIFYLIYLNRKIKIPYNWW